MIFLFHTVMVFPEHIFVLEKVSYSRPIQGCISASQDDRLVWSRNGQAQVHAALFIPP